MVCGARVLAARELTGRLVSVLYRLHDHCPREKPRKVCLTSVKLSLIQMIPFKTLSRYPKKSSGRSRRPPRSPSHLRDRSKLCLCLRLHPPPARTAIPMTRTQTRTRTLRAPLPPALPRLRQLSERQREHYMPLVLSCINRSADPLNKTLLIMLQRRRSLISLCKQRAPKSLPVPSA